MSTVTFPGDVAVTGSLRVGGSLTPAKSKATVLEIAADQVFTVPMSIWREPGDYATPLAGVNLMAPGTGISAVATANNPFIRIGCVAINNAGNVALYCV